MPSLLSPIIARALAPAGCILAAAFSPAAEPTVTLDLWPGEPPGEARELPPEADLTKPDDPLVAGRRIVKLGNVRTPQVAVFRAPAERDSGAAVVVCPGGGHHILAYDLEGTEVAQWLNGIGVTAIVLKYRVPKRASGERWEMAVQDAQRALSLVRAHAADWRIDPQRIGILGFSAGGETAGRTAAFGDRRRYQPTDAIDRVSCRPDFSILVYAAGFVDAEGRLKEDLGIDERTPPAFLVHTFDDRVDALNAILYAAQLKRAGVLAELHVFAEGGHGYGLRAVDGLPVTRWPELCEPWMRAAGILISERDAAAGAAQGDEPR